MSVQPLGIHHVTAVAGEPQRNVDFYREVLGLRMIKQTVNFDAPDTYHLYYGDEVGHPGTVLTFFPWPGSPSGRRGTGQATATAFTVPPGSIGWWRDRLAALGIGVTEPVTRFDEEVVAFEDPDGLLLELVAHKGAVAEPPQDGPVPGEHAVRGFHAVTMTEEGFEATAHVLAGTLGFHVVGEEAGRTRFAVGDGGAGQLVDVVPHPDAPRGLVAAGTVHHVAWRAPDEETQAAWREEIAEAGLDVTPVIDRKYFRSIYFREPGGVLFEIATDAPGFTVDEPAERLGETLQLPPWLEPRRAEIAASLPPLEVT